MVAVTYQDGQLHAESVSLEELARTYGTPCYLYSVEAIVRKVHELRNAFGQHPHRICYAVKANGNLSILRYLSELGCAFDIVSGGELERVRAAGGDLSQSVFSGVGKSEAEIRLGLEAGIGAFHVESIAELRRIDRLAQEMGVVAPVSMRVNPAIDADTHPHIATGSRGSKFGVPSVDVLEAYTMAADMKGLRICGMACHIGSQLLDSSPILKATQHLLELTDCLKEKGIEIEYLDVGGGLGICYHQEQPPDAEEYVGGLLEVVKDRLIPLLIEPGRFIIGNAGVLLTCVEYIKETDGNRFAVVDASMNELMRPALYGAWHRILPARQASDCEVRTYDVVGPVCETTDYLGRQRDLAIQDGDYLAILSAGAYAASMGCTYNTRPLAAEIMIDRNEHRLIRCRGDERQMFASELEMLE